MSGQRDVFYHPHPIFDMPGFGLDALPRSYTGVQAVVPATAVDVTSAAAAHGSNGFEVIGTFVTATSCLVEILDADDADAVLATYTLTPDTPVKGFTFFDTRLQVSAHPNVKFRVSHIVGGGTVAVSIRPTA